MYIRPNPKWTCKQVKSESIKSNTHTAWPQVTPTALCLYIPYYKNIYIYKCLIKSEQAHLKLKRAHKESDLRCASGWPICDIALTLEQLSGDRALKSWNEFSQRSRRSGSRVATAPIVVSVCEQLRESHDDPRISERSYHWSCLAVKVHWSKRRSEKWPIDKMFGKCVTVKTLRFMCTSYKRKKNKVTIWKEILSQLNVSIIFNMNQN